MGRIPFFPQNLTPAAAPREHEEVMGVLNNFCDDVQNATGGRVSCALVPGFVTAFGQEWKVTAHSTQKNIDHILFRAYVPAGGVPTRLDFYEEQMTECPTADDVERALRSFAGSTVAVETLRTLS